MIARAFPYDRPCRFQKLEATETILATGTTIWKPGLKVGGNIPLDLRMEHLNKLLKLALKQLGTNIGEKSAQHIAKSVVAVEQILINVDKD